MKLLTKNTDYAIRALMELGLCRDQVVSVKSISEIQGIPYQYLRKIMQVLIKNGIVESKEGGVGGFRLIIAPEKIDVVKIIKIFQGDIQLSECMFRKEPCQAKKICVLRDNIMEIEQMVEKKFSALTIGKLIKQAKSKRRKNG